MSALTFGSVCSGIEAASQAFNPLGWKAAWFSEIDPFASRALAHHYPDVSNHGDMLKLPEDIRDGMIEAPDVLCGGTPCQAFSVAGLRGGLDDARGALTLTFCEIANEIDVKRRAAGQEPCIVIWENVVGCLSMADNAFGSLLGALAGEDQPLEPAGGKWSHAGCVYGPDRAIAWRVLDAQHFGVPQRRRRVIVVACPLERAHPTSILFELEGSSRDPEQSGAPAQTPTGKLEGGPAADSPEQPYAVAGTLLSGDGGVDQDSTFVLEQPWTIANCLTRRMYKGINTTLDEGQTPILTYVKGANPHSPPKHMVTFNANLSGTQCATSDSVSCSLGSKNPTAVCYQAVVRKLMLVECERLQGFPDGFTDIPGASDTARYMAIGNSWAVPVFRWLGQRIVTALQERQQ